MKTLVTTSWDDGHLLDIRLCEMLASYGIAGTFYISPENRELCKSERLSAPLVRELSRNFEIGAHTMTHPRLTKVPLEMARDEIRDSKQFLQDITGTEVQSFCYPGGHYNDAIKTLVRESGCMLARTIRQGHYAVDDAFEMPTTVHAYPHRWQLFMPWDYLAIQMFNKVHNEGGVFHLWGHSWEIDKHNDWQRLTRVLEHIGKHSNVKYVTNRALV